MGYFLALPSLLLLLVAPFICLNAYLLVWMCGPAIRRAGKCFEEGRLQADAAAFFRKSPSASAGTYYPMHAKEFTADPTPVSLDTPRAGPGPEDAGHRWLGATGKRP